jgi:5'-methylthioinosine phosphorylase
VSSDLAIIGGTGFTQLEALEVMRREVVATPWGEPSAPLVHGRAAGRELVFLARHGSSHRIPPHRINYRANLWALHSVGVRRVIAFAAVGGIAADLAPGTLAFPDQLVDYTWGRGHTFSEGDGAAVTHVDFTAPYDTGLRAACVAAATRAGLPHQARGVYAAVQGPRLETAAEIDRLERDGCTMVGMTGMPEAALARELGIAYACCAVVVNRAAGRDADALHVQMEQHIGAGVSAVARWLAVLLPSLA